MNLITCFCSQSVLILNKMNADWLRSAKLRPSEASYRWTRVSVGVSCAGLPVPGWGRWWRPSWWPCRGRSQWPAVRSWWRWSDTAASSEPGDANTADPKRPNQRLGPFRLYGGQLGPKHLLKRKKINWKKKISNWKLFLSWKEKTFETTKKIELEKHKLKMKILKQSETEK